VLQTISGFHGLSVHNHVFPNAYAPRAHMPQTNIQNKNKVVTFFENKATKYKPTVKFWALCGEIKQILAANGFRKTLEITFKNT